jgi:hypothetical protein
MLPAGPLVRRGYRSHFQGYNQDAVSSEVSSGKLREVAEKLPND